MTVPAARLVSSARRFSSGVSRVCFAGDGLVDHANEMPPVGQSLRQFRQRWHSALRQVAPGIGSSPPWQCSRQRRQSSHFSSCLRICTSDQREQTPSSAPSGQMARHQKRVTPRLSASRKTNRPPMRTRRWKCGCLKLMTVAPSTTLAPFTATSRAERPAVRRVQRGAQAELRAGSTDTDIERTRSEAGRGQAERRTEQRHQQHGGQQVVLRRLPALVAVRLDELRAALGSDFKLPTKWCSDPSGHIQPQKARPTMIASRKRGRAQRRLR